MSPRILIPSEIEIATKLRAEGQTVSAIAKYICISRESVSIFLRDPENYVKNVEEGMTISEIVNGLSNQTVIPLPPKDKTIKIENPTGGHQFQRFNYKKEPSTSPILTQTKKKPSRAAASINKNNGDTEKFYRVLIKHRAVIEYLTRNGLTPEQIHHEIDRVYGNAPDLQSVQFWAAPYQKDRRSKVVSAPKKKSSSSKKKVIKNDNTESVRKEIQKAPKNEKYLLKFKFANMKFCTNGK